MQGICALQASVQRVENQPHTNFHLVLLRFTGYQAVICSNSCATLNFRWIITLTKGIFRQMSLQSFKKVIFDDFFFRKSTFLGQSRHHVDIKMDRKVLKAYSTQYSKAVAQPSTNQARRGLSSEIGTGSGIFHVIWP